MFANRNIILGCFLGCFIFISCKTKSTVTSHRINTRTIKYYEKSRHVFSNNSTTRPLIIKANDKSKSSNDREQIVSLAQTFLGIPYRFGGVSKKGMDCSGLVQTVFSYKSFELPRTSFGMSVVGKIIDADKAQIGDLIFFKTSNKFRINHVGIISKIENGNIYFIHASSSKGVIESSLSATYYKNRLVQINSVIP